MAENEVVSGFVDTQHDRVVDDPAQTVCQDSRPEVREVEHSGHEIAGYDVQNDQCRDVVLEQWVRAHQFLYLWVLICKSKLGVQIRLQRAWKLCKKIN